MNEHDQEPAQNGEAPALPEPESVGSPLLERLKHGGDAISNPGEWRRAQPRYEKQELVRLELRLRNGKVFKTRLHNVSDNGLCVVCPRKVDMYDTAMMRMLGDTGPYEHFKIVHVSSTVGGFKVGMILGSDSD